MKLPHLLKRILVALAAVGVVMPHTSVSMASETSAKKTATVVDVALDGDMLRGQVVNGNGVVQPNMPIAIYQGKERIATTTTREDGEFAVSGLKGGMYVVATKDAAGIVRAWTANAAPPSAAKGVLLVPGDQVSRAQLNGFMDRWGTGVIIIGAFVGTVLIFATESDGS